MVSQSIFDRRDFLRLGASIAACGAATMSLSLGAGGFTVWADENGAKPKLRKGMKFHLVRIPGGSILDRFKLAKELGFEGVEIECPNSMDLEEVLAARDATGVEIHGVILADQWKTRLSDPDEKVRAKALENLKQALRDAKAYGAKTCLVVPGRVNKDGDENFDQVWERSQAEIRKALPLAREMGVTIAIETVWNDFITTPEQLIRYVDQLNEGSDDPIVGAYFDISNMIKYGVPPAEWIRQLGKKMVKFDFKAFSMAKAKGNERRGFSVPIGEGDENWPEVLKALQEVGYEGWATAEVGGERERLLDISRRMDRVLGLTPKDS